ncbi:THAP domain-containing protein 2-like [Aphis craccivora]|uniref:THAP domain-containing protein 2-like n=1 Tax=Aphis craccivora TaxID=307492 RepID=A0A6G0W5L6_APHCR|nr:THAP domain-containing protein 2-like [Aphis craccivora]
MGGCTAVNCSNSRRKGIRLFRFPKDISRQKIWLQNCLRDKWVPTESWELCEVTSPGWFKKTETNAIPTLFDIPNPSRLIEIKQKSPYNCSSQSYNKNSSNSSFQNEITVSKHVIVLENNDESTNSVNFKPKDSDFVNASTLLKEKQQLFLVQQENAILKKRLQLGVNEASNTFCLNLLEEEKYKLFLLQRKKKLLETKLQIVYEILNQRFPTSFDSSHP